MLEIGLGGFFVFHIIAGFLLFSSSFISHRALKFGAIYYASINGLVFGYMFVLDQHNINVFFLQMVQLVSVQFAVIGTFVDVEVMNIMGKHIRERILRPFQSNIEVPDIPFHNTPNDDETCSICQVHKVIPIGIFKCKHSISCLPCIGEYLENNIKICPICRAPRLSL